MSTFQSNHLYKSVYSFLARLWQYVWLSEHRSVQVVVALATILASVFIGTTYAGEIFITIFPILFWLFSIIICFVMLCPPQKMIEFRFSRVWQGLLIILTLAFLLRFVELTHLPPGFHVDETGSVDFALRHVFNPLNRGQTINPFRTGSDSQPILFYYVLRLGVGLFGFTIVGARMSGVLVGTLAVAAVFFMMNEIAGRRMAWLTALLMAVYHYHIHWSRIALNNIWVTLLIPLTLGFFLIGLRKNWSGGAVLAGLCLGFTSYFYAGGYIVILLLPILMWQAWKKTNDHIRLTIYFGKILALALVVAAPLIVFALHFPDQFFDRSGIIYGWNPQAIQATVGNPTAYWEHFIFQVSHSFGAYNYFPDSTGFYAPGVPLLIGYASVLFLWGIAWALYKKQYFPVVWVVIVTIFGGVMIAGAPGSSHFIGVIPAICWLVAIPLDWLIENKRVRWAYILLVTLILTDLFFYFMIYASHPSGDLVLSFPMVEPYIQ
jgi:hypothetical protein